MKDILADGLAYHDLDYKQSFSYANIAGQIAELGFYTNDVQLSGLAVDLDAQSCTFEWKAFINGFYNSTAYVRRVNQISVSTLDLAEQSLDELCFGDSADKKLFFQRLIR